MILVLHRSAELLRVLALLRALKEAGVRLPEPVQLASWFGWNSKSFQKNEAISLSLEEQS